MSSKTIGGFLLGTIFGVFIGMGIAAPRAQADPGNVVYAYAATYGDAVCETLDSGHASFDGLLGIAEAIHSDGLTYSQAGEVIWLSVDALCPQHMGLLNRFIAATRANKGVAA